jgi:putative transposase
MLRGNRFRIYPKKDQKIILEKHFGSCRFIYNKFLHIRQTLYDKFKIQVSKVYLDNHLLVFKDIYPWLGEVNSQSLQQVNKNLDNAFQQFFKGLGDTQRGNLRKITIIPFKFLNIIRLICQPQNYFYPKSDGLKLSFIGN